MSLRNELRGDIEGLREQIEVLEREVRKLVQQRDDLQTEAGLSDTIISLRKRITELEIEEAKKTEAFDREKREVEHMVGLERRRADFEREAAIREAELSVREQNLAAVQENLQKQIDFMVERFTEEVGYLKTEVLAVVIKALPNVNVELGRQFGNGNGKDKADVEA